jgi:hypothetical protein
MARWEVIMPDWHTLRHAYGFAGDVPELLDQLSPDEEAAVWAELWSRVCHQGTVYSASFPVLPYLLAAASKWQPSQRLMPLALAADIVSSWDVEGSREQLIAEHLPVVGELHKLTLDTLAHGAFAQNNYVYLLQAALAFQGDRLWGHELARINDGEFVGRCPYCDADLYIVLGEGRFFCTTEEWVNRQATGREPISPCAPTQLPQVGRWLHSRCLASAEGVLATSICHLFGSSICSNCGQSFQAPDAIGKVFRGC